MKGKELGQTEDCVFKLSGRVIEERKMTSESSIGSLHSLRHRRMEKTYDDPPKFYYCELKAPRWTSWSDENPGRRFYACLKFRDKGCGYFDWHDEKLSVRAKSVVDELRQQIKHLKEENHTLRTEGEYTSKDDSLYWQSLIQTQLDKNHELGVVLKTVKKTKNVLIGLLVITWHFFIYMWRFGPSHVMK